MVKLSDNEVFSIGCLILVAIFSFSMAIGYILGAGYFWACICIFSLLLLSKTLRDILKRK